MSADASVWTPLSGLLKVTLLLWLAGGLVGTPVYGQAFGRVEDTKSNVAYFYHAQEGQATVQVSVWGTIPRPGIYEVPDTTGLEKLLTMAGGAPLEARQKNRKPPRITIQVYRPTEDGRTQIFESRLQTLLEGSPKYPNLRDNDIVVVETVRFRRPFGWRDVFSVASTLGTLTLLALRVFDRV